MELDNELTISVDDSISTNINKEKIKKDVSFDLIIRFYFKNNYNGNILYKHSIDNVFKVCILNLTLDSNNIDINRCLKSLSHELTHYHELLQIFNIFNKSVVWNKNLSLNDFDDNYSKLGLIRYFRDLFYLSLPNEIKARISSIRYYLLSKKNKEYDFLKTNLEETSEWKYIKFLNDFNPNNYINDLYSKLNNDIILEIFNYFNSIMNIKYDLKSRNDLLNYFNKIDKYFKNVSDKYKKDLLKLLSKTITESIKIDYINNNFDKDHSYQEYKLENQYYNNINRIDNIFYIKSIDYKDFF
jgi:hypothetical protein